MATATETDPAGQYDFTVRTGDTFSRTVTLATGGTAINLTNSSATFTVVDTDATAGTLLSLTVGSGVTMGGTTGTITLDATATQMTIPAGVYSYELNWLQNATVTTIVAGRFSIVGSL